MRVLLDENLPEILVTTLRELGHDVESINSLRLKGIDNGTLYREVAQSYDLCLTKDAGFVHNVRQSSQTVNAKLLLVALPQQPARAFADVFLEHFKNADWSSYRNGDRWP